jgi:hypothetical protein
VPSHPHIEGCARLNVGRLNAFRLNFYEPLSFVVIGGVDRSRNVRIEGASVQHVLNDAPDTASVRVHGFVPVAGQPFALYHGDRSVDLQLFGGRILETTVLYESIKNNVAYDLQCIDPTWLLNRRRVLASYTHLSATSIVHNIITTYAPSVSVVHVAGSLPIIDAIAFTNETVATCLTAVCERIGAYWYLDYGGDLHVFLQETPDANPITDASPQGASDLQLSEDLSQVVTRVIARGGSGQAAVDVAAAATEIPITDDAWFSEAGGVVEALAQRITYGGVKGRSGQGALVGVGIAPTSAPTAAPTSNITAGATLPSGVYQYAVTFANATGETLPGPVASVSVGGSAPTLNKTSVRPGYYFDYQGKTAGGRYSWRIALGYEGGGYSLGPPTDAVTTTDRQYELYVGYPQQDPTNGHWYYPGLTSGAAGRIESTYVYRTVDGGTIWYRENFWNGAVSTGGGWLNTANQMTDADLLYEDSANGGIFRYPTGPTATFNAAKVSGLQTLPPGFTTRKLYRTAVNSAQLKLRATDPTDPLTDTALDATLGANAPTSDTSGVVVGGSQTVTAGSPTIPVTDTTPFTVDGGASGGWANVGNLVIRYTGISGANLTGLPATGAGALTAAVRHGAVILVQPRLTGVAGITRALTAGEPITLRLELDDLAAQQALTTRLFGAGAPAEDGVVEEAFSDSQMTLNELLNYAKALLLDRKDPRHTLRFVTRDTTVRVGRLITVNVTQPPISGTFRVQRITFDEIAISGGLARTDPRRTVEASNKLFTFADLLRRLRGREGGAN